MVRFIWSQNRQEKASHHAIWGRIHCFFLIRSTLQPRTPLPKFNCSTNIKRNQWAAIRNLVTRRHASWLDSGRDVQRRWVHRESNDIGGRFLHGPHYASRVGSHLDCDHTLEKTVWRPEGPDAEGNIGPCEKANGAVTSNAQQSCSTGACLLTCIRSLNRGSSRKLGAA